MPASPGPVAVVSVGRVGSALAARTTGMPVLLPDALLAEWSKGTPADAARISATMGTLPLAHYPVSPRVNSAGSESADLIEPAA